MTQMLLFDAANPATDSSSYAPVITPVEKATEAVNTTSVAVASPVNGSAAKEPEAGLNHMGDLARLVILRYQLVAKRRAEMEARRRAAK